MNHYWAENWKTKLFDIVNFIILLIFTLIVVYPLWLQLMISLNDPSKTPIGDVVFWTKHMTLNAYKILFQDTKIIRGTLISVLRVVVAPVARCSVQGCWHILLPSEGLKAGISSGRYLL